MIEQYDELDWDISEIPIGSSTPDELYELSYRATTQCPDCGEEIRGIANYHSHDGSFGAASWLASIDYEECECQKQPSWLDGLDDDDEDIS